MNKENIIKRIHLMSLTKGKEMKDSIEVTIYHLIEKDTNILQITETQSMSFQIIIMTYQSTSKKENIQQITQMKEIIHLFSIRKNKND